MKYSIETYLSCEYWPHGEEVDHSQKIITVRKEHPCASATRLHNIAPGEKALLERAIIKDQGRVSAYTCLPCLDAWIDEHPLIEVKEQG